MSPLRKFRPASVHLQANRLRYGDRRPARDVGQKTTSFAAHPSRERGKAEAVTGTAASALLHEQMENTHAV